MTSTSIERFGPEHADAVRDFFTRVPESDHNSFAEDIHAPGIVDAWLADERASRAVALDGERVLGYLAVIPLVGWSSHVGSLRVVVDPDSRGRGVGRQLARHGLLTGLEMGLTKIVVEVVADAEPAIGMFQGIGFEPEALLRDHVRDRAGSLRDLVVLAHLVEGTWSGMETAGLSDELA
jgi:ribosomal protein S18 acetylase RimI-like enzyme